MIIRPLSERCNLIYQKQEHICFGISPFNSLFSEEYLIKIASWGMTNFKSFHFFIPDDPTTHTLEALGYGQDEARKKMKKQINWLRNKMFKSLSSIGLRPDLHIIDWQFLSRNSIFNSELDHVFKLFDSSEEFRKLCLNASRWVLQNKIDDKNITDECLIKAVKYFLSEIPMFAATNKILGIKTSIFCYHQSIEFHEKLYSNQLDYRASIGQGYGKIILSD